MKTETKLTILFFSGPLMCLMLAIRFTPTKEQREETEFMERLNDTTLIKHSEIPQHPKIDLTFLLLRRISTILDYKNSDLLYWQYKSLYQQTENEKFRKLANKEYWRSKAIYKLYQKQTDSAGIVEPHFLNND